MTMPIKTTCSRCRFHMAAVYHRQLPYCRRCRARDKQLVQGVRELGLDEEADREWEEGDDPASWPETLTFAWHLGLLMQETSVPA